jgi:hypothetical protein
MKIPLYFNFTGKYQNLLDLAIKSVENIDVVEIRVHEETPIKPFTYCLNKILSKNTSLWFFMHYDSEIIDENIFHKILSKYSENIDITASVAACDIVDLLALYDSLKLKKINGWDEKFLNSYMELDLRNRIYENNFIQPILYNSVCPPEMIHNAASSLRKKNDSENNLYNTYVYSLKNDIKRFVEKYPNQSYDKELYEKIMNETWA